MHVPLLKVNTWYRKELISENVEPGARQGLQSLGSAVLINIITLIYPSKSDWKYGLFNQLFTTTLSTMVPWCALEFTAGGLLLRHVALLSGAATSVTPLSYHQYFLHHMCDSRIFQIFFISSMLLQLAFLLDFTKSVLCFSFVQR